jgi:hypothetical protein
MKNVVFCDVTPHGDPEFKCSRTVTFKRMR